jgi:hypothetical protein|tara:strand:+ start:580 stop:1050 length:471 start_codon:yes stop_codon:yes gene_type:complete
MGDLLNFSDHIDKTQNKQRYLGYEKGKVLEETIKELIAKIPDIPEENIISYFTKIVKGEIPVMDDKPFHTKYVWAENYLEYSSEEIQEAATAYMFKNKSNHKLLYHLSLLNYLSLYFFDKDVKSFYKISPQDYEKWGIRLLDKSIEFKNKVRDGNF